MKSWVTVGTARPMRAVSCQYIGLPILTMRWKRYEAFDAQLDKDALAEARAWFSNFDNSHLPKGDTTFARSSGAGGQHVNK